MTEAAAQQPTTPEAAQARLTELSSSPEFRSKIDAQDPTAFSHFQALSKTIAGGIAEVASATTAANDAKLVSDFLAAPPAGFPDLQTPAGKDLAEILQGKSITPELRTAVKAKLDSMIADREWGKRLEAKDQTALREFQIATVLLTAEVSS
jgi:hypothetical protein